MKNYVINAATDEVIHEATVSEVTFYLNITDEKKETVDGAGFGLAGKLVYLEAR